MRFPEKKNKKKIRVPHRRGPLFVPGAINADSAGGGKDKREGERGIKSHDMWSSFFAY